MSEQHEKRTLPRPHTVDEIMTLVPLPSQSGPDGEIRRFAGLCPSWLPGSDLPLDQSNTGMGKGLLGVPAAAYGGHVYAQSGLAACRVVRELETESGKDVSGGAMRLGFHTIHGYFTSAGLPDRPYVYAVTCLTLGPSFATLHITARQPTTPSTSTPPHIAPFPLADAHKPLGRICFTAVVSFKSAAPHSGELNTQQVCVQERFKEVLTQKKPEEWPRCPSIDIDLLTSLFGNDLPTTFPMLEMRKVDMTAWNRSRGPGEKKELILYRLPRSDSARANAEKDALYGLGNIHSLVHAFAADRNGVPMLANLHEMYSLARAASLTYSYTAHTNPDDAIMRDGWWVQETLYPRVAHGRGILTSKIWSPEGLHVATTYQDAMARVQGDEESQLERERYKKKPRGKI